MKKDKPFAKTLNSTGFFLVGVLIFVFASISCAETVKDSLNKDSQKYLSFYENVDGDRIHWEANFYDGEITSIYKNGKRIPDDLVNDYKDKVYSELDEMRHGSDRFSFKMPVIVGDEFNFDMDELNKELEEMQKNLPKLDEHFKMYKFNDEEFKKQMEELGKELKENKYKIYKFNDEKLKEQMEELKKELEENKSKIHKFKFNDEDFKKQMEELKKELKENLIKPEDFNFYYEQEEDTEA